MSDKFTLRDFFAFFFSGIVVILFMYANYFDSINSAISCNLTKIKDFTSLIIFLTIPVAYFLGQIVHSIDTLMYFIGRGARKIKYNKTLSLRGIIVYILNGHRISGKLYLRNQKKKKAFTDTEIDTFWKKCAQLQVDNKFSSSEYWYVMNELFKGLTTACLLFLIISLIQNKIVFALSYLGLGLLFWVRASFFSGSFVDTVERTYELSNRE